MEVYEKMGHPIAKVIMQKLKKNKCMGTVKSFFRLEKMRLSGKQIVCRPGSLFR